MVYIIAECLFHCGKVETYCYASGRRQEHLRAIISRSTWSYKEFKRLYKEIKIIFSPTSEKWKVCVKVKGFDKMQQVTCQRFT